MDPSASLSPQEAESIVHSLGVQDIEQWLKDVTGVSPGFDRLPILLYKNQNEEAERAGVDFSLQKQFQRLSDGFIRVVPIRYTGPTQLKINTEYVRERHEMDGVLCHENGHLWTQGLMAAYPSSDAYLEGFAELFRSAAALWGKKNWEEAMGCNGFEVLHGPPEPHFIPAHEGPLPPGLAIAARSIVCNRVMHLLGGLTREKLAGIARACAIQPPVPCRSLAEILESIERETNTPGFANNFTADPLLRFGSLQTGTSALAFPNAAGDSYYITCFTVTDTDPRFLYSRSSYPESCKQITFDDAHFHRQGIQISYPRYAVHLTHETGMRMQLGVRGSATISPRRILLIAAAQRIPWPSGEVQLTFQFPGESPTSLQRTIRITDEMRENFLRPSS